MEVHQSSSGNDRHESRCGQRVESSLDEARAAITSWLDRGDFVGQLIAELQPFASALLPSDRIAALRSAAVLRPEAMKPITFLERCLNSVGVESKRQTAVRTHVETAKTELAGVEKNDSDVRALIEIKLTAAGKAGLTTSPALSHYLSELREFDGRFSAINSKRGGAIQVPQTRMIYLGPNQPPMLVEEMSVDIGLRPEQDRQRDLQGLGATIAAQMARYLVPNRPESRDDPEMFMATLDGCRVPVAFPSPNMCTAIRLLFAEYQGENDTRRMANLADGFHTALRSEIADIESIRKEFARHLTGRVTHRLSIPPRASP